MNYFEGFLLLVHIGVAVAICGFVLLQHGKGADMGAAFGSGTSGSLFGASGSANFLSHTTAVLAAVFFLTSIGLTWYVSSHGQRSGVMERSVLDKAAPVPGAPSTPVAPAGSAVPAPATPAGAAPATGAAPAAGAAATVGAVPAAPGSKAGEVPK